MTLFVRTARANIVERGVAPDGIVEAIDIASNGLRSLVTGIKDGAPEELGLDRLEERLDHGIVVAISFSGHGGTGAVAAQFGLVVYKTILAAAVRMVNEPFGRPAITRALRRAASARSRCRRSPTAQPITRRENIYDHSQIVNRRRK